MPNTFSWKLLLCSYSFKIIAIVAMIIDHIGYFIYPDNDDLRIIGRIAFPLFAFSMIYGFHKTSNPLKYLLRISVMFFIIQIPMVIYLIYFDSGIGNDAFYMNIFLTLMLAGISICTYKTNKMFGLLIWASIFLTLFFIDRTSPSITIHTDKYISSDLTVDYGTYGFSLITLGFFITDLIVKYVKKYKMLAAKVALAVVFFTMVMLQIHWFDPNNSLGNIRYYALVDLIFIFAFMDVKISLNKYIKEAFYLVYPVSLGITILFS